MTEALVDLWLIRTDQPAPVRAALRALLDGQELQRAHSSSDPVRRRRFVVAHGAARQIAGHYAALPGAALRWRRGPHGKPELVDCGSDLTMNLTASEGLALFAVAHGRPVGVDLEQVPTQAAALRLAQRYYAPAEAAYVSANHSADRFARLWTRKEACVKAFGGRLAEGLGLPLTGEGQFAVAGPHGPCRVADLPVPGPFRAAVALAGTAPYRTRQDDWSPDHPRLRVPAGADPLRPTA